jgi:glycogen debranching enzyme
MRLRDSLLSAVVWVLNRLEDPRGGGYLWVQRALPTGIANQVWEDSVDSYHHADGTLFDPEFPYAPVAPQGYVYDALLNAAELLERAPGFLPVDTAQLRRHAHDLRAQVLAEFWMPEEGTFAHALEFQRITKPSRVVASAPGHLLTSRLLDGDDATAFREKLAARLAQPDLLAAAGLRTKSSDSPRFRAGSYHNGSTWPMDSGVIADGLRRHGFIAQAHDLEDRILRACATIGGFPEFLRGDSDETIRVNTQTIDLEVDGTVNRLEQPPQAWQGWTATRVWRILRSRGRIRLRTALPSDRAKIDAPPPPGNAHGRSRRAVGRPRSSRSRPSR